MKSPAGAGPVQAEEWQSLPDSDQPQYDVPASAQIILIVVAGNHRGTHCVCYSCFHDRASSNIHRSHFPALTRFASPRFGDPGARQIIAKRDHKRESPGLDTGRCGPVLCFSRHYSWPRSNHHSAMVWLAFSFGWDQVPPEWAGSGSPGANVTLIG